MFHSAKKLILTGTNLKFDLLKSVHLAGILKFYTSPLNPDEKPLGGGDIARGPMAPRVMITPHADIITNYIWDMHRCMYIFTCTCNSEGFSLHFCNIKSFHSLCVIHYHTSLL